MVCGLPVIVPASTWLSDTAPADTAVCFDSPEDLANAIAAAINRLPILSGAAKRHAAEWRQRHNADSVLESLLSPAVL